MLYAEALRRLVDVALAEYGDLTSAVRTYQITVVLDDSEYRDIHLSCHIVGFLYDHAYQILRGSYDHDAFYRKGLEYGKRYITGSRRHVYEEIIQFSPCNICPELCDNT